MKERPIIMSTSMVSAILEGRKTMTRRVCQGQRELSNVYDFQLDRCPYGVPGDRLWVRETWRNSSHYDGTPCVCYKADNMCQCGKPAKVGVDAPYVTWRPSIHMYKSWARIWLEIIAVRVERLQEITETDAMAEGLQGYFRAYWDSLNAKRGYPWESNPWVWVISFKRGDGL